MATLTQARGHLLVRCTHRHLTRTTVLIISIQDIPVTATRCLTHRILRMEPFLTTDLRTWVGISLPRLTTAMDRRRRERSGLLRLLEKVIGLDMKMRQYEEGKRFCDAVVERGGIEALNRAWESPAALPTAAELRDPGAWLARTAA